MISDITLRDFWSVNLAVVVGSLLFNIVVGILGMNTRNKVIITILGLTGMLLTLFVAVSTAQQSHQLNTQASDASQSNGLIRRIAAAQGININQPIESLATKSIERQLGSEAVNLSNEILGFVAKNSDLTQFTPSRDPSKFDEDTKLEMQNFSRYMNLYNEGFLARSLSLLDRIKASKVYDLSTIDERSFTNPVNTFGINEVASTLGRVGYTLLHNAQ